MTPALTPAVAVDYLRELSADLEAAVVLDADGKLLAGDAALAEPARHLIAAAGDATDVHVTTAERSVFAARDDRHAIVVATGRFALPSLARYDLRMVLADLAGDGTGGDRRKEPPSANRRGGDRRKEPPPGTGKAAA